MSQDFKICKAKDCGQEFNSVFSKHRDYCSSECYKASKKSDLKLKGFKPIPNVSKKRQAENLQYQALRKEFLEKPENKTCFIDGCNKEATTIEHRAGRWGTNFLDTTTWAGCCLEHNLELENNPELSKKYQFSKLTGKNKI